MRKILLILLLLANTALAQFDYGRWFDGGFPSVWFDTPSAPSYDPDAQALFDRGSNITDLEKTAINTSFVYVNGVSPGLLDSLGDVLVLPRFFSNSTDAVMNWLGDYSNATIVNSMTFTSHTGFTGNGTTTYLNSNHNPSTFGGEYTQNSATFGVLVSDNVANNNFIDLGVSSGTFHAYFNSRNAADGTSSRSNANTTTTLTTVATTSIGYHFVVRRTSTTGDVYRNTTDLGDIGTTTTGIPNGNFFVGAWNNTAIGAQQFSTRTYGGYWIGGKLSAVQISTLITGIEMGLDVLSAGVIAMNDDFELRFYGESKQPMPDNIFELYPKYKQAM